LAKVVQHWSARTAASGCGCRPTRASISASITNGGISTSGQLDTLESTRRRLEARLNGGGPPIRISGTNGGITIAQR
jgi:hypothetical protein